MTPDTPSLGALLDSLLAFRWLPATWSNRIWCTSELPVRVGNYIRMLPPNDVWRAYSDSAQLFCAIARIGPLKRHATAAPRLEVHFLDGDARIYAAGIWEYDPDSGWRLEAIPALSESTRDSRLVCATAVFPGAQVRGMRPEREV